MDHRRVPADCLPDKLATSDKKPVAVFHILTTRTPPRPSYTTSMDSTAGLRRPLLPLTALLPLRAPPPMSARVSTRSSDVSPGCPRPWPVAAPTEKDLWLARADWMKHRSDQARVAGSVNGGHPPSAIRHPPSAIRRSAVSAFSSVRPWRESTAWLGSSCIRMRCNATIAAPGAPPWPADLQPCRAAPPARGRPGSGRTRPANASGRWRRGSPCGSPQAAAVQRGGRRGRRVGSSAGRCLWPMMDDPGQWASAFSVLGNGA